ncbi:GTP cyclohydrolase II [Streptomyces acidiscabies]|uniref:GTP cyclohydrolase-2 n=1 Tax=Streptomyces acidiscabies TaxID=42234 RepID=A0A0L0KAZ6_9ACTN|nr:GTP cyclohydrolase II [Streptomyces acidiscabies]KND35282.1 GTP cyclohydrolase [Streptomyces acidiscabies]
MSDGNNKGLGSDATRDTSPGIRARVQVTLNRAGTAAELVTFTELADHQEHVAVVVPVPLRTVPLVRLHSECLTGDVFGSARCDCGPQLEEALQLVAGEGGAVLYLRQEGRGIGLYNKLDAYVLQDRGSDTFEANRLLGRGEDERDYTAAAEMLRALGLTRIRLLSNNPDKAEQLTELGIEVVERVPTGVYLTGENGRYLDAKARHAGHTLPVPNPNSLEVSAL